MVLAVWTIGASSSSCSTDKSHKVTWSSAPEAAKTEVSDVCHSTEVMGAVCHEKWATGEAFLNSQSWSMARKYEM